MRPLYQIAQEIRRDWKKIYFGAAPYLDAMSDLDKITDNYYQDSASSIVNYFLANATTWKGEKAREIKKELNTMVKQSYKMRESKSIKNILTLLEKSVLKEEEGYYWINILKELEKSFGADKAKKIIYAVTGESGAKAQRNFQVLASAINKATLPKIG